MKMTDLFINNGYYHRAPITQKLQFQFTHGCEVAALEVNVKLHDSPDSKGMKIIKWPHLMSQPHKETYLNPPKNIRQVLFWHITAK